MDGHTTYVLTMAQVAIKPTHLLTFHPSVGLWIVQVWLNSRAWTALWVEPLNNPLDYCRKQYLIFPKNLWYLLWRGSDLLRTTQDHDLWLRGFWGCGGDLMVWCEIPRSQPQMAQAKFIGILWVNKRLTYLWNGHTSDWQETMVIIVSTPVWYITIKSTQPPTQPPAAWCMPWGRGFRGLSRAEVCCKHLHGESATFRMRMSRRHFLGAQHLHWAT